MIMNLRPLLDPVTGVVAYMCLLSYGGVCVRVLRGDPAGSRRLTWGSCHRTPRALSTQRRSVIRGNLINLMNSDDNGSRGCRTEFRSDVRD